MRERLNAMRKMVPQPVKDTVNRAVYRFRNVGFKPYRKKKHIEGVAFDFWIGDVDGRDWYDLHCTDPLWLEMRFIRDHLVEPGDIVFDCGAHHGCTTILLSHWVGDSGKVIAFEPFPKNCEVIKKNIQLNGLRNVVLEEKAAGAEKGRVKINSLSNSSVISSGTGINVDLVPLDDYGHMNPTFLKVDVEGFEVEVLRGAQRILSKRPKFDIEIHPGSLLKYGFSIEDLFRGIDVRKYKLWIQWADEKPPEEYDMKNPITKRVHLFGVPDPAEPKSRVTLS